MLAPFHEVLDLARSAGKAVGAFTCYSLAGAIAVARAARGTGSPVVFVASADTYRAEGGDELLACLLHVASTSPVPACVQLDHVDDAPTIERAIAAGAGSIMADGSRLPFDQNQALVRWAVDAATSSGAGVEGELGRIEGNEEREIVASAGSLTAPELVPEFTETGLACLAIAIGNAHGRYEGPVALDWERLDAIGRATSIPLSLHGASGLSDAELRRAVTGGISKVNVNTELRHAYLASLTSHLPRSVTGARVLDLHLTVTDELSGIVAKKMEVLWDE